MESTYNQILTVITGGDGGGSHYYFNYNERVANIPSASRIAVADDGKVMAWDIRNNGGQVVISPSIHPDTRRKYVYKNNADPITATIIDMPDWIFNIVTRRPKNVQINNEPSGFCGFECVGIMPDEPRKRNPAQPIINGIVTFESQPVNNSIPLPPNGTFTKEPLRELLSLLADYRADNYDDWLHVIWAIKSVSDEYNDLAHEFSQRCPEKYNAEAVDKVWNEGDSTKENSIGIGSLFHWLKEDIGLDQYRAFRTKHKLNALTLVVKGQEYNPYESYYFRDYLDFIKNHVFSSEGEAYQACQAILLKLIRVVTGKYPIYYIKLEPDNMFQYAKWNDIRQYNFYKIHYEEKYQTNGRISTDNR